MRTLSKTTIVLFCGVAMLASAARGQSLLDGLNANANGAVRVIVIQPDGKIIIGGDFTTLSPNGGGMVTRNHIARLNPDTTLDTAFDPNANCSVESIAVQTDGSILAGGQFTKIGGQPRNRIARLEAATGLAYPFDPNASERVYAIAVQADGKILVGGVFNSIGGERRRHLARIDPATGLADAFDPNPDAFGIYAIALQADGKILAGGSFHSIGGQARNGIARLEPTTGVADSFDPHPIGTNQPPTVFHAIAVQPDGKILAAGDFGSIGGEPRNRIARLDATTGLADSFDPDASGGNSHPDVSAIAVQADGKILVGGAFTNIGGQARNHLARLEADIGLADSFDPSPDALALGVYAIAVQSDGKVLTGGQFSSVGGQPRNYFARLEATTGLNPSSEPEAEQSFTGDAEPNTQSPDNAAPDGVMPSENPK